VRQQQIHAPVEPAHGVVELIDGGAGDELAPQALEHRGQQGVGEGEVGALAVPRLGGAAHDGEHAQQPLGVIAQRAQVHGQIPGQQAHLAGAVRVRARTEQRVIDDVHQIRARHGLGRPHQVARRPEHRDVHGARHQAVHEAHVGLETAPRPAGDVLDVQ